MVHFLFATDPLPILLFWLNFGAWVVIWIGLVLRDRGFHVDVHTPTDQGSRTLIGISLWSGVLLALLTAWAVPAWGYSSGHIAPPTESAAISAAVLLLTPSSLGSLSLPCSLTSDAYTAVTT